MKVYLDTSAVVKLIAEETESSALKNYLDGLDLSHVFSSELLVTETRRAATRKEIDQRAANEVLDSINLFAMTFPLLHQAGMLPGASLRSLDAIHLATALRHGAEVMVCYDRRLQDAAEQQGIATVSPV